jgi:hypothetical protein
MANGKAIVGRIFCLKDFDGPSERQSMLARALPHLHIGGSQRFDAPQLVKAAFAR